MRINDLPIFGQDVCLRCKPAGLVLLLLRSKHYDAWLILTTFAFVYSGPDGVGELIF